MDVKCLDIKYAENKVVTKPIDNVTAKPFTGPEPKINKITAAIKVVMLASRTVIFALFYSYFPKLL